MKNRSIYTILLLSNIVLFSACGSSDDTPVAITTTQTDEDTILRAVVKIDDLTINVHTNTFTNTDKYYKVIDSLTSDYAKMSQAHTERMNAEMQLLNTLAQAFDIAPAYTTYFSKNSNYNATTPAIIINKILTNNYFLVSSPSHFYVEGKTIKTYFKDASSLSNAWSRAISNADKTKDLYLSVIGLDSNSKVTNVTNSLVIKSATLSQY